MHLYNIHVFLYFYASQFLCVIFIIITFYLFTSFQVVTTLVGTFCFPIDTVKRRLMIQRRLLIPTPPVVAATVTTTTAATSSSIYSAINNMPHSSNSSGSSGDIARLSRVPYRSGLDCARRIIREEGVRGLYAGLSVNLVRGFSGAILLVAYDEFKSIL